MTFSKFTRGSVGAVLAVALTFPALNITTASGATNLNTVKNVGAAGGINKLIAACQKEGQLNVIALPHYWANWGDMLEGFKKAYGVKIDEANPEGSSQEEIDAANTNKGTSRSPDVFDIGIAIADKYAGTHTFAPYKVKLWKYLTGAAAISPTGEFTPDYTGTLTIGYDGSLGTITKLDDLLLPKFKGKIALNGDPMGSSTGLNGVFMINKALGGTFDDVSKAVAFFKKLKDVGNFINVNPTEATIASGQTPVVIDNGYVQAGIQKQMAAAGKSWKMFTPALVGSTYNMAISAWAPHPACARLWFEYALGETGAKIFAIGGATPALWVWLVKTGRAPAEGIAAIGKSKVAATKATADQGSAAIVYLKKAWPAAVGS